MLQVNFSVYNVPQPADNILE